MVGNHVAQGARLIVVAAARFDAQGLGDRDLYVVDVAAIPQRLEDAVGKAKDEDILHRFLAEIVIDAINLVFAEHSAQFLVEGAGRSEVATKRLLDDDATPLSFT